MPGVLKHGGDAKGYCLIPLAEPAGPRLFYGLGHPITAAPLLNDSQTAFRDTNFGREIPKAIPVFEREVWAPGDTLYAIQRWPCYPVNFALFEKLPFPLIDALLARMTISRDEAAGKATYQVSWDGLTITKTYDVTELGVGVAVWPGRALPNWSQFFMMFAPGTEKTAKSVPFGATGSSGTLQPLVYSTAGNRLMPGNTVLMRGGRAAMARSTGIPRFVAISSDGSPEPQHGILPLFCQAADGAFSLPEPLASRHAVSPILSELKLTEPTLDHTAIVRVSIDFGTTNTAIAVSSGGADPQVLQFSDDLLARNLSQPWADPGYLAENRFSFFPMRHTLSNPLPTILVEADRTIDPFHQLMSVPRRSIPADRLDDDTTITNWFRADIIKQEFKWQQDKAGEALRSAFLEMLGWLVGCELRSQPGYNNIRKAELVFTCPLSFTQSQTESLVRAQQTFKAALEQCGYQVELRDGLVSESLANLYLIRNQKTGRGSELPEERHVVIDVGGGSTDISVFRGDGVPMFLDSLYLGGKDFPDVLARLANADGAARTALDEALEARLEPDQKERLSRLIQLLLLRRLQGDGGIDHVASRLAAGNLKGAPADFLTLLVFSTVYGVKMASLRSVVGGEATPDVTQIRVWFVGLGSRLFGLSPLARSINSRQSSAKKVLESACFKVIPKTVKLAFEWGPRNEAKLSVCRGALMVPEVEPALDLVTPFWADFPDAAPQIAWSDIYDRSRLVAASDRHALRRNMSTEQLQACVKAAIESIRSTCGFADDPESLVNVGNLLHNDYSKGVGRIAERVKTAPRHPVIDSTEGLKENIIGLMKLSTHG